jgi:glycosyltransferase involved in cell wall biosynthesis
MPRRIYFTVTNDLVYDQRMHRICGTLAGNGYLVTLVGRKLPGSPPCAKKNFEQRRLNCWFKKGKWFYREYNIRLLLFLLFRKIDAICAIDLDSIMAGYYISRIKKVPRIYDAHELFTELKEVISRPAIQKTWTFIEKKYVPNFPHGYTVSEGIASEFKKRYGLEYAVIRNVPVLRELRKGEPGEKFILYQGAVNEGRGFEWLIPAMKQVNARLFVCGDGNFMGQLKTLVNTNGLSEKVILKGVLDPEELWQFSQRAYVAVAIAEKEGLNQLLALPNKFFDYIHAGLPQVSMDFPEYRRINQQYRVALLLPSPDTDTIASALNNLLHDNVLYSGMKAACLVARQELNWQQEEKKLLAFYSNIFKD